MGLNKQHIIGSTLLYNMSVNYIHVGNVVPFNIRKILSTVDRFFTREQKVLNLVSGAQVRISLITSAGLVLHCCGYVCGGFGVCLTWRHPEACGGS